VKRIPYGHQAIDGKDMRAVTDVLKSDWITQGPRVEEFETALCRYTGARYAVAASSGTAGLHLACMAAGIGHGEEVITSPITFAASANCALYCGGKTVFADVEEDTVNISPERIEEKISARTKAVIPVHFAGHPARISAIYRMAKRKNLTVIEDACHALGALYRGGPLVRRGGDRKKGERGWIKVGACEHSDMAVFSFHPVKSITTGEGGAVLTNNRVLYNRLRLLRNHGITKDRRDFSNPVSMLRESGPWYYEQKALGYNFRITDLQCALGISQLKKIGSFMKRRREITARYDKVFSGLGGLRLPAEDKDVRSSRHIYYIRLANPDLRKGVFESLHKRGIIAQVHYIPVHLQPYYRKRFGYREGDCPVAEDYYRRTLTLPIYPGMRKRDVDYVIKVVKEIFQ